MALEPVLVEDDRVVTRLQVGVPLEVERLDLLQPVALVRDAKPLRDDLVQVDEHLVAQQVVELVLARAVLAGQPLQSRDLVRRVVVDVHRRIGRVALADQVDHAFDGPPFLRAVVRPERPERRQLCRRSPTGTRAHVRAPRTGRPRCRRRGRRRSARAAVRSRVTAPGRAPSRRDRSCAPRPASPPGRAASRTCAAPSIGGRASSGAPANSSTVAMPSPSSRHDLIAAHPRDEAQVIVRTPAGSRTASGSRSGRRTRPAADRRRSRPRPRSRTGPARGGSTRGSRRRAGSRARACRARRASARACEPSIRATCSE